jgi:hypothetical protein
VEPQPERARDAGTARPHLDQTPDEWAAFARRGAELAARLR